MLYIKAGNLIKKDILTDILLSVLLVMIRICQDKHYPCRPGYDLPVVMSWGSRWVREKAEKRTGYLSFYTKR